jgi:hypothetical protein
LLQLPAGRRQAVFDRAALGVGAGVAVGAPRAGRAHTVRPPLEQLHALEPTQAFHEQRARDPRQPAIQVAEAMNGGEQLAHDQRRPAIGEESRRKPWHTTTAHGVSF